MNKKEKIGIVIIVILIIILAIIIWDGQKTTNPKIEINCQTACHQIGNNNWIFPGAGPISVNIFSTKEDCISACQARFKK